MKTPKRKYRINADGYGVFYRCATSAGAALRRVYLAIFGTAYDVPWQADYWTVEEVKV